VSNQAEVSRLRSGRFAVEFAGHEIIVESEEQARLIGAGLDRAYILGQRQARRKVREALGLRSWGDKGTCLDR